MLYYVWYPFRLMRLYGIYRAYKRPLNVQIRFFLAHFYNAFGSV
nr:MAG TPA: hypothetical protein [Caudoviricetes sp.]